MSTVEQRLRSDKQRPFALEVTGLAADVRSGGRRFDIIQDVSFSLQSGETLGLVGESGSGKTVTALALLGLLPPEVRVRKGTVLFAGQNLLQMAPGELEDIRGRDIGIVFQEPRRSLNPAFTVGDQIAETARRHLGLSRNGAWDRTIEMLSLVKMPSPSRQASNYPHELSGGMCQRAMIAMAMVCEPKMLIADEPTTALDVTVQDQILWLLRDIQQRTGLAILFVTHDLGVIAQMSTRVAVMYAGNLVEVADVHELFRAPRHPYSEGLLAAVLPPDPESDFVSIPGQVPRLDSLPAGCCFHPRCRYSVEGQCDVKRPPLLPTPCGGFSRCLRINELTLRGIRRD